MPKKRIAILGGGVGAMTTAAMLTDPNNPRCDDYEITVYQMGWRLGGKGASGRNRAHEDRIEEHGLHIWFGCYDNAFRMIRSIYRDLERAPDAPLAGWRDAFKPHSYIILKEHRGNRWVNWPGSLPTNDMLPGEGNLLLPLPQYVLMAVKLMLDMAKESRAVQDPAGNVDVRVPGPLGRILDDWISNVETAVVNIGIRFLEAAHLVAKAIDGVAQVLVDLLGFFMDWLWNRVRNRIDSDTHLCREWILFNFFYANIRGSIEEGVLEYGLDVLNDYDYREFLAKYGYDDGRVMADSAWVLGIYDGVFAFVGGSNGIEPGETFPAHAKVEAGNVMRAGIRQFFAYKGASIWKMQAGMGDTIFGPIYEVLKSRGVRFEFFHKVEAIRPSADGRFVDEIRVARQCNLTPLQSKRGGYDPLIDVKGLNSWPSEPRWEQIQDGERMQAEGVNFESYACEWPTAEDRVLRRGDDFDEVVLGISVGALPYVACDLVRASSKWSAMMQHLKTARTQAFQLWLAPTAYQLGWHNMQRPVLTGYEVAPFDTWADMSNLVDRENWRSPSYPLSIAYFCGVMPDTAIKMSECGPVEPPEQFRQEEQNEVARANALDFLRHYLEPLWPDAVDEKGALLWDLLIDPGGDAIHGEARFDSQYWRANVQPSERYVLSVPGSSRYRLPANDPNQFTNLYLSGDWTDNGFNLGCVEAAAMSGLLASNALCGYPARSEIVGLDL